jgi:hypothetical protein
LVAHPAWYKRQVDWTKESLTEPLADPGRWEQDVAARAREAAAAAMSRPSVNWEVEGIELAGSAPATQLVIAGTGRLTRRRIVRNYELWGPEGSWAEGVRGHPEQVGRDMVMWFEEDFRGG